MNDFEIRGADDFLRLSKALKEAGHGELRKELTAGMRQAAKPLIAQSRQEALRRLPKGGGLAKQASKVPQRVQVRTGVATAGVRIAVGTKGGVARAANRGLIRHPVFGNRDVWVDQHVPAGWFDDTMRAGAPVVRPELEAAIDRMAEKIVREVKRR